MIRTISSPSKLLSRPAHDLSIGDQSRVQFCVVHVLRRHLVVDRNARCRRGRLTCYHQDRLHSDAAERRVACRERESDEDVVALARLRYDRAVADLIRTKAAASTGRLAFASDHAVFYDAT